MRWEQLFADLEGRARALADDESRAEVAERTRGETAQVTLVNRLRAQLDAAVSLSVLGAGEISGAVRRVGPDYLLIDGREAAVAGEQVVVLAAIQYLVNLAPNAVTPDSSGVVEARLGLSAVLREVTTDRSAVTLTLRDGTRCHGTLARVGADWVDLAEHRQGDVPRADRIARQRTVPFAALAVVRRVQVW